MLDVLIRYGHFLGIFGLVSMVVCQNVLLRSVVTNHQLQLLTRLDALYGLSAFLTLAAGLGLWFGVGKPASFYTGNPVFHIKVTLFVVIGLLSIYPTVMFTRLRRANREQAAEHSVALGAALIGIKRTELLLIILLPLLAVVMAQGIGL